MSDLEELSLQELEELRQLLEAARMSVEQQLSASAAGAKPVDLGLSIGRLSRVDAMQQQQMALARRQRAELQLTQVRTALARLSSGGYGACLRCGQSIGYARLRARPETTLCRDCQSGGEG